MRSADSFPWLGSPDEIACNFSLWHLVANLPRKFTVDGKIHAETYISAVGAIAGYAAQKTLFARNQPGSGLKINVAKSRSGDQFWFGDALNDMLVARTTADAPGCVWPMARGGAYAAGLAPEMFPMVEDMFKFVASTIGGENEGKSSVAEHQAHLPARA